MSLNALALLVSDPAFLAMDATARGMHLQLAIVAAGRTPAGTLTAHEPTWRRYLGMGPAMAPAKSTTETALASRLAKAMGSQTGPAAMLGPWMIASEGGETLCSQDLPQWQEHLWQTHWKPMLMEAWQPVDEDLVKKKPHLARALGGYYCPAAEALAREASSPCPLEEAVASRRGKKKASKKKASPAAQVATTSDIAPELEHDLDGCRQIGRVVEAWDTDLNLEARRSLWDVGAGILAGPGASSGDRGRARGVLRKLIKEHGETAVAEAVGTMSARTSIPADPTAFLVGMLKNKQEGGTPMEQKARAGRADVAL